MKRLWILLGLLVTGCAQQSEMGSFFSEEDVLIEDMFSKKTKTTVSMMLPLTGTWASTGENFQKAALLALDENPTAPVRILFFDTKSTEEGTKQAYKWAMAQKPDIILGPIFSTEFKALPKPSLSTQPVLGYTSDNTLLNSERASMAVLIPEQVQEIVHQSCKAGKKKLAVIGPEGKTGEIVMNTLDKAISSCPGMVLNKYALYPSEKPDMSEEIQTILPTFINPRKKDLTNKEKELLATPMQKRLAFDSLLIFEDGTKLTQVMSILAFYDVTPNVVPIYALANAKNLKDPSLNGILMTDLPSDTLFTEKYQQAFGKKPLRLASLAYDSVGWIAKESENGSVSLKTLRNNGPYNGIDGLIRLNPDGSNNRGLRIIRKTAKGIVEAVPAPSELHDLEEENLDEDSTTTKESVDSTSTSPSESDKSPSASE